MGFYAEKIYPFIETLATSGLKQVRQRLLSEAGGFTLEIGAGAGQNIKYLPQATTKYLAIEPNNTLVSLTRDKLTGEPWACSINLVGGVAEAIPLGNDSVDTVVSFLVLCTVTNPQLALREIHRVLRPGGQLLFFEHIHAANPKVARLQRFWEPVWRPLACGCHLTRKTDNFINDIGFSFKHIRRYSSDKMGFSITSNVIEGSAIKKPI